MGLTIFRILDTALVLYSYGILIYIFMSWFPGARDSSFGRILASICEPYLDQFRKIIPPIAMLDLSPIVALIVLRMARYGLNVLAFEVLKRF